MNEKFLGLGLTNIFGLFILFKLFNCVTKVVFTKYEIEGISQIFRM